MRIVYSFILFILFSASSQASEGNWYGEFNLENGIRVTHSPKEIVIYVAGQSQAMSSCSFHAKAPNLFGIWPLEDGKIDRKMSEEEFKREVVKLAALLPENPSDKWLKTFKLANGLIVTHTPKMLMFQLGQERIAMSQFFFYEGNSIFQVPSKGEGKITTDMDMEAFRAELNKLSTVLSEE